MGTGGDRMNNTLLSKPPADDPARRAHQAQVRQAIVERQTFAMVYLLTRLKNRQPYENYRVPDNLAQFEFTVKGVVRLELLRNETETTFAGWRRLFGSNTKAQELSTWRSRASVRAFAGFPEVRAYVKSDPLLTWSERSFPWRDDLPQKDWYVLWQVQDVWIKGGQERWSDLLGAFLLDRSKLLQLIPPIFDVLPPANAGRRA
jgi:hypothetical protein